MHEQGIGSVADFMALVGAKTRWYGPKHTKWGGAYDDRIMREKHPTHTTWYQWQLVYDTLLARGKIDADDWYLDDKVDGMAKDVGKTYRPAQDIIDGLHRRIACTTLVQKMFIEILVSRGAELDKLSARFPVGKNGKPEEYEQYMEGALNLGDNDPLGHAGSSSLRTSS